MIDPREQPAGATPAPAGGDKGSQDEAAGKPLPRQSAKPTKSLARRLAASVLRVLIAAYLGTCLVLYFLQSKLLYHPYRELETNPRANGMEYEDVYLQAEDGVKLHAWFVPAEHPRGVVLLCHGNAGNISHRIESIQLFNGLDLSVFIFDYRGYGHSEGKPSEAGTHLDAQAAWKYLVEQRKVPPEQILIFGRSLGGSVASHLAVAHAPSGLIVESSFTSIPDLGQDLYFFLPVRWLSRFHYDTREAISQVRCPVLVIHSRQDNLVPFRHGQRLFQAAPQPKTFLEISGSHNDGWITSLYDGYHAGVKKFCGECLSLPLAAPTTRQANPGD